MASWTPYAIYFLDAAGKHCRAISENRYIRFFRSTDDLIEVLSSLSIYVTVCVCCPHDNQILSELQALVTVASIYVCPEHRVRSHNGNHFNHYSKVKEFVFDNAKEWQLSAHTDALHVNSNHGQMSTVQHIWDIKKELIQEEIFVPHDSTEEQGNAKGSSNEIDEMFCVD